MKRSSTRSAAALLSGCAIGAFALAGPASAATDADRQRCESLAGRSIGGAQILAADAIVETASLPWYCRVRAVIAPKLNFELRLPENWNSKLHYGGGGGYNGSIPPLVAPALQKGFAQVSSDSGHQGNALDASFVQGDPQAAALFGYLSVPIVTEVATKIVSQHYRQAPKQAYFEGCSNGGREALMNVQRFPWLFDGVIARAPAYNWVGVMGAFNRTAKALDAAGGAMSAAKVSTLSSGVLATCDAADGVTDGLVSHTQACQFNPAALRCPGGADTGDSCLSDAQLAVVDSWTNPATFGGGAYRNSGWPLSGNENAVGAWDTWVSSGPRLQFLFQDTTVKYYLAGSPLTDSLLYDYDSNPTAQSAMAALNDATDLALQPFLGAGGKLILWHGTNDSALSYRTTLDYHRQVQTAMGGPANAEQFIRMYLAPGVNHCAGGPGADTSDLLEALDGWVTRGNAPGTLLATKLDANGATVLSRPLCVHPSYARYNGSGDARLASSFACVVP